MGARGCRNVNSFTITKQNFPALCPIQSAVNHDRGVGERRALRGGSTDVRWRQIRLVSNVLSGACCSKLTFIHNQVRVRAAEMAHSPWVREATVNMGGRDRVWGETMQKEDGTRAQVWRAVPPKSASRTTLPEKRGGELDASGECVVSMSGMVTAHESPWSGCHVGGSEWANGYVS